MNWALQLVYQSVESRICTARANWSPVSSAGTKTSFLKVPPMAIRGVRTSGPAILPAGDLPNLTPHISYKALKTHLCRWTWFLSEFLPEMLAMPAASKLLSSLCHLLLSVEKEDRLPFLSVCCSEVSAGPLPRGWCFEKGSSRGKKKKTTIPSAHSQTKTAKLKSRLTWKVNLHNQMTSG